MATLTVQSIVRTGLNPTYAAAAAGGDKFLPSERTFLHVKNTGAGAITVTVVTPFEVAPDIAMADVAVSVPNAGERIIGPFPPGLFQSATDGLADITYSGVTSVTVAALRLSS